MADPHAFSRHHYLAWVEERIEEYKSNLTRDELLELADDAVAGLFVARGACTLTEVLLRDAVDELIFRRLSLPSYRQWAHPCHEDTAQRPPWATPAGRPARGLGG